MNLYLNPIKEVRKLKTKQILYFYEYFKQEFMFIKSFRYLYENDYKKEKNKIAKIFQVIKNELKRREILSLT